MIDALFSEYLANLRIATDPDLAWSAISRFAEGIGLPKLAYIRLPPVGEESKPRLLSTYNDNWLSHYLAQDYARADPVIRNVLRQPVPFPWGPTRLESRLTATEARILDEASYFGIIRGFTIPIDADAGTAAAVTFATSEGVHELNRIVRLQGKTLTLAALYLHLAFSRFRRFQATDGLIPKLTPREAECLKWAAEGKSATDTAVILNISHHTVAFHLENAKARLGVRTVAQAIRIVSQGW